MGNTKNTVYWSFDQWVSFIKTYKKSVKEGKESFFYEGQEFVTAYAKYMVEYYNERLPIIRSLRGDDW